MADSKVSGLAAVAAFADTQEFPVNDSGTSRKITGAQLRAAVAQGTIGYASITATSASFTTVIDIAGLTVTTPVLAAGRRLRITFYGQVTSSVTTDAVEVFIMEGATQLAQGVVGLTAGGLGHGFVSVSTIVTPSAAAHTYKISAARFNGTGNGTVDGATTNPAYILVEDIGT